MNIIKETHITKARNLIQSLASAQKSVIVLGRDEAFNKKMLENKQIDCLIISLEVEKDYMKQRASGLNESMSKLAARNKITIGVDAVELSKGSDKDIAQKLARLKQNIMLCKKAKTDLVFINTKNKQELRDLMITLGGSTSQAKKAIEERFLLGKK